MRGACARAYNSIDGWSEGSQSRYGYGLLALANFPKPLSTACCQLAACERGDDRTTRDGRAEMRAQSCECCFFFAGSINLARKGACAS